MTMLPLAVAAALIAADAPATQPAKAVLMEAPLAEGWPAPDTSGEVVLVELPAYRMAVAGAQGRAGRGAFGKLFRHIKANGVKMTAPVEMEMKRPEADDDADDPAPMRMVSMGFLYERPDQGETGEQGEVEVVDVPAMKVLSVGFFGNPSRDRIDTLEKKLRDALAAGGDYDGLEAAGPVRLMGYNSPFIPAARRFHELQLPVARAAAATQPAA